MNPILPPLSRRQALAGFGAALAAGRTKLAFAGTQGSGPKLVIINVRGGLDGLSAVIPYGDANLAGLRGGLVPKNLVKIDNFFALDPSMPNLAAMFAAGEALAVHAVGPIQDTRSHFLGQDVLQAGTSTLQGGGWLNRALSLTGYSGPLQAGLALGPVVPPVLQGQVPVTGWCPDPFPASNSSIESLIQTDASNDAGIGAIMSIAFQDRDIFTAITQGNLSGSGFPLLAQAAGLCLASPYGPQAAVLQTDSVDTHYNQTGRMAPLLTELDQGLLALKTALGASWANTVVLTMTEFGRTAYENGTAGTDHGTGFAVFLAGGPVIGGRVVVNQGWPGLGQSQLYQQRDLNFTSWFQQVALSVLFGHMGIASSNQEFLFPGSTALGGPLQGLVSG